MTQHDVKVEPRWFERIRLYEKSAEVRWAGDRDYQAGDTIRFARNDEDGSRPWHYVTRTITHVLSAGFVDGLESGWVVLSLADPRVAQHEATIADLREALASMTRSAAVLRGQNRKLRER